MLQMGHFDSAALKERLEFFDLSRGFVAKLGQRRDRSQSLYEPRISAARAADAGVSLTQSGDIMGFEFEHSGLPPVV
jgi:hypothetical protein